MTVSVLNTEQVENAGEWNWQPNNIYLAQQNSFLFYLKSGISVVREFGLTENFFPQNIKMHIKFALINNSNIISYYHYYSLISKPF